MFLAIAVKRAKWTILLCLILLSAAAAAQTIKPQRWPRTIENERGTVVVYSPQLESILGDKLTAVSAVSVKLKSSPEPVFGAVWFSCRINVDRTSQEVSFSDLKIPNAKFPDVPQEKVALLAKFLEQNLPISDIRMPMANLVEQVNLVQQQREVEGQLDRTPPEVFFATKPTVLVFVDGPPKLKAIEGSRMMRVVNSPYFIVFDGTGATYYLKGGSIWYSAPDWKGPWKPFATPPAEAVTLASNDFLTTQTPASQPSQQGTTAPDIIVTTGRAEIVETTGEPQYVPISGTQLMYVGNTDRSWFLHSTTRVNYVLLAGRWFTAAATTGPWQYLSASALPEDFKKIPADSPAAVALYNVPGTVQLSEAVANLQVPQTAEIDRSTAKFTPVYDGEPKFQPITGTNLSYAQNSPQAIIKTSDGHVYANEDAVWYDAKQPAGPYDVTTSVPQEIYSIPPSSPVYNVTYSHVYDSTPQLVYVGYTPGYTGSYYYDGSVCYGTGWDYPYWYGDYYYAEPYTYGVGAAYNPWTDNWRVRFGYYGPNRTIWAGSNGWVGWGTGWYGGWVAGGMWDHDYDVDIDHHWAGQGNWNHQVDDRWRGNIYDRASNFNRGDFNFNRNNVGSGSGAWKGKVGALAAGGVVAAGGVNRLRGAAGGNRPGRPTTLPAGAGNRLPTRDGGGRDNLYTDKDGNIFRQGSNGAWEQRAGNQWKNAGDRVPGSGAGAGQNLGNRTLAQPGRQVGAAGQRPNLTQPRPSTSQRPTYDLNRQAQARQQAAQRTRSYQQRPTTSQRRTTTSSRSSSSRSRSSGSSARGSSGRSSGGRSSGGGARSSGGGRASGGGGGARGGGGRR